MSNLNSSVYAEQIIRENLITGEIPAGTSLRESVLAKKLGISRTPVREAFSRLAKDGLLVWEQKRGYQAKSLTEEELDAAYPVLIALETLAIEHIQEPLEVLARQLREMQLPTLSDSSSTMLIERADRAWHQVLVAATHNPILIELHERLLGQVARYIAAYWHHRTDFESSQKEHDRIIEALERDDRPLATALLRSHRL